MTLEKATEIKRLLDFRDELISQLKEFARCDSITGHINSGSNGLGFGWDNDSRQIRYLIEGTKRDIERIEKKIETFEWVEENIENEKDGSYRKD